MNKYRESIQYKQISITLAQRGMDKRVMNCLIHLCNVEIKYKLYKDYAKDLGFITLTHLCEMHELYLKYSIWIYDLMDILKALYKTVPFMQKGRFKNTMDDCGLLMW